MELHEKLGSGVAGDLYRATDDLGREVAVKLIRPSGGNEQFALAQARALARIQHPNVVTIHSLTTTAHPDTGLQVPAIVMELLKGTTLRETWRNGKLEASESKRIGSAIADGVAHLHEQNLTHGDLHVENVMVDVAHVKLIDLLYYDTLAVQSTQSREARLDADAVALRQMLCVLLGHSTVDHRLVAVFNNSITLQSSIAEIRAAFLNIFEDGGSPPVDSVGVQPTVVTRPLVDRIKELVPDHKDRIKLHDAIDQEVSELCRLTEGEAFSVSKPEPSKESVQARAAAYESRALPLATALATIFVWGEDQQLPLVTNALSTISRVRTPGGMFYNAWGGMRHYPSLLTLYACGITGMAFSRFTTLKTLLYDIRVDDDGQIKPLIEAVNTWKTMSADVGNYLPGQGNRKMPLTEHLAALLPSNLHSILNDTPRLGENFDRFEYLQALVGADLGEKDDRGGWFSFGRFAYKFRDHSSERLLGPLLTAKTVEVARPLLDAGFFQGSFGRFEKVRLWVHEGVSRSGMMF